MRLSRDLSLVSPRKGRAGWKDAYKLNGQAPVWVADYVAHRFGTDARAQFADLHRFTRASDAWAPDASGTLARLAPDTPRLVGEIPSGTQQGLLIEPASRNALPNPAMTGGALGSLDAGGALPGGWTLQGMNPSDVTVLALSQVHGLPACTVRLHGPPSAGDVYFFFNARTDLAASAEQPWQMSTYLAMPQGSVAHIDRVRLYGIGWTAGGSFVSGSTQAFTGADLVGSLTPDLTRHGFAGHLTGSACAQLQTALRIDTGGAVDITLQIAMPQAEVGTQTSTPLPTDQPRAAETVGMKGLAGDFDIRVVTDGAITDLRNQTVEDGYWPVGHPAGLFRRVLAYPAGTL